MLTVRGRKWADKMDYVREVLSRFAQVQRRRLREKRFVGSVPCAYCRGSGVDPRYGNTSRCPVCAAAGIVAVTPPVVSCLRCSGSGREGGDLTCLACRGTGVVSVRKEATPCARCSGTGEDGVFYCGHCKGQGIV